MASHISAGIPTDRIGEFQELNGRGNALDWLWEHVAPGMAERRRARTAVLLMLASPGDRGGHRGRLHVLLPGEPGTGKSVLRDWVRHTFSGSVSISPDSSEAGLRYDANLHEPGALHQAHGGVLCIEELDKFKKSERDALYEAMSEGIYEVKKSGIDQEFQAETRVLAVCNDTPFKPAFLDRFDFYIEMDGYDESDTLTVTERVYSDFRRSFIDGEGSEERPLLPDYLAWVQAFAPSMDDASFGAITEAMGTLVGHSDEFIGDIRQKEAYLRTAFTIARLNRRDIYLEDWVRAVDIIHPSVDCETLFADHLADAPAA